MEKLRLPMKGFSLKLFLNIFRKYVETILVRLKYDKNNDYFTRKPVYIYDNINRNSS